LFNYLQKYKERADDLVTETVEATPAVQLTRVTVAAEERVGSAWLGCIAALSYHCPFMGQLQNLLNDLAVTISIGAKRISRVGQRNLGRLTN
jgi:hypothetical protein